MFFSILIISFSHSSSLVKQKKNYKGSSSGTRGAIAGLGNKSTHSKGLVWELAVYAKAARHGGTGGSRATLAKQTQLKR